jgi:hypothetical protein
MRFTVFDDRYNILSIVKCINDIDTIEIIARLIWLTDTNNFPDLNNED